MRTDTESRLEAFFWRRVERRGPDECWEWRGARFSHACGNYGDLRVEDHREKAHRFAYRLLVGPIPEGLFVCHTCDNPPCVNPAHLFLGTNADNVADRESKGRTARGPRPAAAVFGERNGNSKLTSDKVGEIRRAWDNGRSMRSLAREHGVSHTTIEAVLHGRRWAHA